MGNKASTPAAAPPTSAPSKVTSPPSASSSSQPGKRASQRPGRASQSSLPALPEEGAGREYASLEEHARWLLNEESGEEKAWTEKGAHELSSLIASGDIVHEPLRYHEEAALMAPTQPNFTYNEHDDTQVSTLVHNIWPLNIQPEI